MTQKRRRGNLSFWLDTLQLRRSAKRRHKPITNSQSTATPVRHNPADNQRKDINRIKSNRNPDLSVSENLSHHEGDIDRQECMEHPTSLGDAAYIISHNDDDFQPFGQQDSVFRGDANEIRTACNSGSQSFSGHHGAISCEIDVQNEERGQTIDLEREEDDDNRVGITDAACDQRSIPHISDTLPLDQEPDFDVLQRQLRMWNGKLNLTALVAVVGSVRYTVEQYNFSRHLIQDSGSGETLPPYSRTHRYFGNIIDTVLPKSHLVWLPKKNTLINNCNLNNFPSNLYNESSQAIEGNGSRDGVSTDEFQSERVRIFQPSAWAKLDIATSVVFNEMFPALSGGEKRFNPLDNATIVRDRDYLTRSCDHIFVQDGDQFVPCIPGATVNCSVQSKCPSFASPFQITSSDDKYVFTACIGAVWCVGAESNGTSSSKRAIRSHSLTACEKFIIKLFSTASPPHPNLQSLNLGVLPGDICGLLRPENDISSVYPILVHRYWKCQDGIPSIALLWIRSNLNLDTRDPGVDNNVSILDSAVVESVTLCKQSPRELRTHDEGNVNHVRRRSHGFLADGTLYVIYRILLYCDDFQKSSQMSPKGSAGGCYFLPLSLPARKRRNTSSVRIISLTPPGISTNEVLHYIVPDLVHASLQGVEGRTPSGERVRIFLDVTGFVGDYPASACVIDVAGHVSRAPCTHCTFRRLQEAGTDGSKYGYTTNVHANNSTFLRHGERHQSLRKSNIPDIDTNRLGMVGKKRYSGRNCPLLHFQEELELKRNSAVLADDNQPVAIGHFDAYRSNVIAADHLLTGLSKDILNVIFLALPTDLLRMEADINICAALRTNGLLTQKERELDGANSADLVHNNKKTYFSDLKAMSKRYVQAVDRICKRSQDIKQNLDKPNLHRLLELYEHTIPAYGHVREVMELVFECAHQPLKQCIARSNNRDAHIFAIEHCVGNDWQGRLASLSRNLVDSKDSCKAESTRGIRRLLLGEQADLLDEEQHKEFISKTDEVLRRLFTNALSKQFEKDTMISNFNVEKTSVWKARGKTTIAELSCLVGIDSTRLRRVVHISRRWIMALYPDTAQDGNIQGDLHLDLFTTARRLRVTSSGRQVGKPAGYDGISGNYCVQVYLDPTTAGRKMLVSAPNKSGARLFFFAILAVLERKGDSLWAICLKCVNRGKVLRRSSALDECSFHILRLTPDIRRVALYHICDEQSPLGTCEVNKERREVTHTESLLGGGRFYFQCRVHGYPPRMA